MWRLYQKGEMETLFCIYADGDVQGHVISEIWMVIRHFAWKEEI